ncbi:MAG TPA: (2Fe-2S) ferredoxin domain-containing protein [Clostridia bacterium]|nr:(2Fe-2S) ferredoxin domain-containing protein [Clostridia bacterium]
MPKFEKHIFVCTNQRSADHPRGSCDPGNTGDLHRKFKAAVAQRGLKATVRANKSGCLDQCEHGPTVVVYPEAVWYGKVTTEDVNEIVESHIVGGCPVARLMLSDECINSAACEHKAKREAKVGK